MSVRTAERRRSRRQPASHTVAMFANNGNLIARGKTSNISETGIFLVAKIAGKTPENGQVVLELSVPRGGDHPNRGRRLRTVRCRARIVRSIRLGHLVGLGIEFLGQLA